MAFSKEKKNLPVSLYKYEVEKLDYALELAFLNNFISEPSRHYLMRWSVNHVADYIIERFGKRNDGQGNEKPAGHGEGNSGQQLPAEDDAGTGETEAGLGDSPKRAGDPADRGE